MLIRRRLPRALVRRGVPWRTRTSLLAVAARRRLRPVSVYEIRFGRGRLPLTHEDYPVDWETLKSIVVDRIYDVDFSDAVVLDVGSHKGYFGAFALERGARAVISFEPESANFRYLKRCATTYVPSRTSWLLRRAAVGARPGAARLHVMSASWGHSLEPPDEWAQYKVGDEQVDVVAMSDVLVEAAELAEGTSPIVVKINAEGGECSMVLGTPSASWEAVTHAFVATHPWADCRADELAAHLERAGLRRCASVDGDHLLRMSR